MRTYRSHRELKQAEAQLERKRQEDERASLIREQELQEARAVVRQQEADNWIDTQRLRADESALKLELSRVARERELVNKRDQNLKLLEDQRRRNR